MTEINYWLMNSDRSLTPLDSTKSQNPVQTFQIMKNMRNLLIACLIATTFFLTPVSAIASAAELSPAVSTLSKKFSESFCTSIGKGMTLDKAGQRAVVQLSTQLSQGIFFSPVMNELMSTEKENLATSLSNNIFDECGNDLGGTKEGLESYLTQLASKVPDKSKGLNLPQVRQREPLKQ